MSMRELGCFILLFKMHTVINVCFPNMPKEIMSHCSDLVADFSTMMHSALFMFITQTMQKWKMPLHMSVSHRKLLVTCIL